MPSHLFIKTRVLRIHHKLSIKHVIIERRTATLIKVNEYGEEYVEHSFVFNPHDNGGEQLRLNTQIVYNGDEITEDKFPCYFNQTLNLMSYGNSVSLNLLSTGLTPACLRKLADELENKILSFRKEKENKID